MASNETTGAVSSALPKPLMIPANPVWQGRDLVALAILQIIFWIGTFHHIELPGLYMDGVNPDYLAARVLFPQLKNPSFLMPTVLFPVLGSFYHGVQNFYVDLPVFLILGINITSVRIAQSLFGAAIVALVYLVAVRLTGNRMISFAVAAGLAADIAFLASFRTQYYIILSGNVWLLLSILFAFPKDSQPFASRNIFLSGLFLGLAVYSYFVFLFFLPVLLWLVLHHDNKGRSIKLWVSGFFTGMLPYVAGYLLIVVALKGFQPAIEWISVSISGLAPLSSRSTMIENFNNALSNASYAIGNSGNEFMMFGIFLPGWWVKVKLIGFSAVVILGLTFFLLPNKVNASVKSRMIRIMVWIPISYFCVSLFFGARLSTHHYSALVPLMYLVAGIVLHQGLSIFTQFFGMSTWFSETRTIAVSAFVVLAFNLHQQSAFFQHLDATGGVGKMSNSTSLMSAEALSSPVDATYFFPEWGFFMPFNLLTANKVPYELELTPDVVRKHMNLQHEIRVAYWKAEDGDKYREVLKASGLNEIQTRTYFQRDKNPAFHLMFASP